MRKLIRVGASDTTWRNYGFGIPLLIACMLDYSISVFSDEDYHDRLKSFQDSLLYSQKQMQELNNLETL